MSDEYHAIENPSYFNFFLETKENKDGNNEEHLSVYIGKTKQIYETIVNKPVPPVAIGMPAGTAAMVAAVPVDDLDDPNDFDTISNSSGSVNYDSEDGLYDIFNEEDVTIEEPTKVQTKNELAISSSKYFDIKYEDVVPFNTTDEFNFSLLDNKNKINYIFTDRKISPFTDLSVNVGNDDMRFKNGVKKIRELAEESVKFELAGNYISLERAKIDSYLIQTNIIKKLVDKNKLQLIKYISYNNEVKAKIESSLERLLFYDHINLFMLFTQVIVDTEYGEELIKKAESFHKKENDKIVYDVIRKKTQFLDSLNQNKDALFREFIKKIDLYLTNDITISYNLFGEKVGSLLNVYNEISTKITKTIHDPKLNIGEFITLCYNYIGKYIKTSGSVGYYFNPDNSMFVPLDIANVFFSTIFRSSSVYTITHEVNLNYKDEGTITSENSTNSKNFPVLKTHKYYLSFGDYEKLQDEKSVDHTDFSNSLFDETILYFSSTNNPLFQKKHKVIFEPTITIKNVSQKKTGYLFFKNEKSVITSSNYYVNFFMVVDVPNKNMRTISNKTYISYKCYYLKKGSTNFQWYEYAPVYELNEYVNGNDALSLNVYNGDSIICSSFFVEKTNNFYEMLRRFIYEEYVQKYSSRDIFSTGENEDQDEFDYKNASVKFENLLYKYINHKDYKDDIWLNSFLSKMGLKKEEANNYIVHVNKKEINNIYNIVNSFTMTDAITKKIDISEILYILNINPEYYDEKIQQVVISIGYKKVETVNEKKIYESFLIAPKKLERNIENNYKINNVNSHFSKINNFVDEIIFPSMSESVKEDGNHFEVDTFDSFEIIKFENYCVQKTYNYNFSEKVIKLFSLIIQFIINIHENNDNEKLIKENFDTKSYIGEDEKYLFVKNVMISYAIIKGINCPNLPLVGIGNYFKYEKKVINMLLCSSNYLIKNTINEKKMIDLGKRNELDTYYKKISKLIDIEKDIKQDKWILEKLFVENNFINIILSAISKNYNNYISIFDESQFDNSHVEIYDDIYINILFSEVIVSIDKFSNLLKNIKDAVVQKNIKTRETYISVTESYREFERINENITKKYESVFSYYYEIINVVDEFVRSEKKNYQVYGTFPNIKRLKDIHEEFEDVHKKFLLEMEKKVLVSYTRNVIEEGKSRTNLQKLIDNYKSNFVNKKNNNYDITATNFFYDVKIVFNSISSSNAVSTDITLCQKNLSKIYELHNKFFYIMNEDSHKDLEHAIPIFTVKNLQDLYNKNSNDKLFIVTIKKMDVEMYKIFLYLVTYFFKTILIEDKFYKVYIELLSSIEELLNEYFQYYERIFYAEDLMGERIYEFVSKLKRSFDKVYTFLIKFTSQHLDLFVEKKLDVDDDIFFANLMNKKFTFDYSFDNGRKNMNELRIYDSYGEIAVNFSHIYNTYFRDVVLENDIVDIDASNNLLFLGFSKKEKTTETVEKIRKTIFLIISDKIKVEVNNFMKNKTFISMFNEEILIKSFVNLVDNFEKIIDPSKFVLTSNIKIEKDESLKTKAQNVIDSVTGKKKINENVEKYKEIKDKIIKSGDDGLFVFYLYEKIDKNKYLEFLLSYIK